MYRCGVFGIEAVNFEPSDVVRDVKATAKTDGELLLFSAHALESCAMTHPRLKQQILRYQLEQSSRFSAASEQTREPHAEIAEQPGASAVWPRRTSMRLVGSIDHATMETRLAQLELVQTEMLGLLQQQSQDIQTLLRLSTNA